MKAAAHLHAPLTAAALRPGRRSDVPALYELIRHYSDRNILLPRTVADLRRRIADFRLLLYNNQLVACGMLQIYTKTVAELRSLAVSNDWRGAGLGRQIVEALLAEARSRGLEMVFAFTNTPAFFSRVGFLPIDRDLVPWKAWNDCTACPKRECCDEIAMAYWLKPSKTSPSRGISKPAGAGSAVHFPIVANGSRL